MLQLVTYRPGQQQPESSFFILSKGLNAGKPLNEPCANCFIATCETENEKEFYFWLCWGLWQAKRFEHLLCGSVIPFIRKKELFNELQNQAAHLHAERWKAAVIKAQAIHAKELQLQALLKQVKQLKAAYIRSQLH